LPASRITSTLTLALSLMLANSVTLHLQLPESW
jgi:hypothetical protein